MGQKVNPIILRKTVTKDWDSVWVAKKSRYPQLLASDFKLRDYIKSLLVQAGVSRAKIERQGKKVILNISVARPGLVIGKKGADIEILKNKVTEMTSCEVVINILEVKKPELDSTLVAESAASQLERRVAFRKIMKRSVQTAMRAGAKGIKIMIAGRLGGAEIARTEWYREGRVPLHTRRAEIDYGTAQAKTTYGIIGVKVWIYK